jgi:hypothetical protein
MRLYVAACSVCGAAPFRDPAGFTLKRFDASGRPSSDPNDRLFCETHVPPRTRIPRAVPSSPVEAITALEQTVAEQHARLDEAIEGAIGGAIEEAIKALTGLTLDDLTEEQRETAEGVISDGDGVIDTALDGFRAEIARVFAEIKKALAARAPDHSEAKPKRAKLKPVSAGRRQKDQGELIAEGEAADSGEDAP